MKARLIGGEYLLINLVSLTTKIIVKQLKCLLLKDKTFPALSHDCEDVSKIDCI